MVILSAFFITTQIIVIVTVLLHRRVNIGAGNCNPRHGVRVFFLRSGKPFIGRLGMLGLRPCRQYRTAITGMSEKQKPSQQ